MKPSETVKCLETEGFEKIQVTDTGDKYLEGYNTAITLAESGKIPLFGTQILLGPLAPQIVRNAARNIEEGRTYPVQITCSRPA
jgi:hypothetical protein